jgi:hypothetical protein
MPSLKELYEKAQSTGKVEYDYFTGGSNSKPFNQTSIGFGDNDQPYIRLGYDPAVKFRADDPTNTFNTALAATRDTFRITEFLSDFPNGPLFLAKQVGLQLSNPDVSYKSANGTSTVLDQLNGPRFYNPLGSNTISQIPSGVLGIHYTRHGLSPLNDTGYLSLNTNINGTFESRLTTYKDKIINNETQLNTYTGGPDSTLGLGRTTINSYRDSTNAKGVVLENNNTVYNQAGLYPENNNGFIPFNYETIRDYGYTYGKTPRVLDDETNNNINVFSAKYPLDFRKWKDNSVRDNYLEYNVHNRIGVTSNKNNIGSQNTIDSINILKITKSETFFKNSVTARKKISPNDIYSKGYGIDSGSINGYYGRDIIKFRIEALNNDKPVEGGSLNTDVLAFRAYLENMSDVFNPQWKEFNYLGRGEPFYTYEKFSRDISFTFTMFAHSEQEMSILYTKLNYLMSLNAPDYKNNQMRGNYIYLTIGDYIYRQPGVISSMTVSDHFAAPWEIALNEPEKEVDYEDVAGTGQNNFKHYEIPKYLKIQLGFKPIHNFLPKRINSDDINHTATFVTPNHMLLPSRYNRYLPSTLTTINTVSQEQQSQINAQNVTNLDQITGNLTSL